MTLAELVLEYPENIPDADVAADLNLKTIEYRDTTRRSLSEIEAILGTQTTAQVIGAVAEAAKTNPYLSLQLQVLSISGWDFSDARVQSLVNQFVSQGVFSADVGNAIKAIGIRLISKMELNQLGEATEAAVAAVRLQEKKASLKRYAAEKYNVAVGEIDAGTVTTEEQVRQSLGSV
jgi:hypothetical protein